MSDTTDGLAEQFEEMRPRLRAVAYRMLGSVAEADDVVQDAWLRLSRSDTSEVQNLRGWLTTVVARLCLDALRSRKARREDFTGFTLPEPIVSGPGGMDPEQEALLADSIGLAMLIVLETLTPAERLAFVLHDVFAVPFEEIAPIVDRTPTATRQLASRARRRVQGAPESDADIRQQREVGDAFLAASRAGDFDALLAILDPDVVARADFGRLPLGQGRGARGRRCPRAGALVPGAGQGSAAGDGQRRRGIRCFRRRAALRRRRLHRSEGADRRDRHPGRPGPAGTDGPDRPRRLKISGGQSGGLHTGETFTHGKFRLSGPLIGRRCTQLLTGAVVRPKRPRGPVGDVAHMEIPT